MKWYVRWYDRGVCWAVPCPAEAPVAHALWEVTSPKRVGDRKTDRLKSTREVSPKGGERSDEELLARQGEPSEEIH